MNERTGEVVQISDKTDPDWTVDARIRWSNSK
ncbi:colicin E5-related ribonuclease [Paraburkholderia solisilvae]